MCVIINQMSNRKALPKVFLSLAWRATVVVVFTIVAGIMVILAMGYRVNIDQRTLEPTGAVTINGKLSNIEIYAGGVKVGDKLPITITGLTPTNTLQLRITKNDYVTWAKNVMVEQGLVTSVGEVKLWFSNPLINDAQNVAKVQACETINPSNADDLLIFGGEIRTKSGLITRISSPVVAACWFEDNNHVVFATAKNVFIIEADGDNAHSIYSTDRTIDNVGASPNDNIVYVGLQDAGWKQIMVAKPE